MKLFSSVAAAYLGTALLSSQDDGLKPVNAWVSGSDCEDFVGSCSSGAATYRDKHSNTSINGYVIITGYADGIDPKTGAVNNTLVVIYDLKGCNGNCTALKVEDNRNFCEEVSIGELDPDNIAGDIDIVENINPIASNVETIDDVDTAVNQLFNRPIVVQDTEGRVLACAMFKEITNTNNNSTEGGIPLGDKNKTLSGAMSSASSAAWVFFVATTMVIAAVL